jgi:hypothetical protein
VAQIRIVLPYSSGDPYGGEADRSFGRESQFLRPGSEPQELSALQMVYATPLMSRGRNDFPRSFFEEPPAASWQRMLARIPAERQPAEKLQKFFTAAQVQDLVFVDRPRNQSSFGPYGDAEYSDKGTIAYRAFAILAATPEEAEQRAKALLTILDQGFSRPTQKGLFKMRGELCDQLRESEAKLTAVDKAYQAASEEFKTYSEFPDETLTGLRVQLFQWEAELAGLRSKIEACEKLVKEETTVEGRKQIQDAKRAAEIELAGCEGRRNKSAEFIAKVKQRREVERKRNEAYQHLDQARDLRKKLSNAVLRIDEEIDMFGPVRLVDDTVIIQPVEWTKN